MPGQPGRVREAVRWATAPHCGLVYASADKERARLAAWMQEALSQGFRVLHKHTGPAEVTRAGLVELVGSAALRTGQVALVDAAVCHADTGGEPDALMEWHREVGKHAQADGYDGVAIACDGPALRTIAPDPARRLDHEHDLSDLAAANPMMVYCRYHTGTEPPDTLAALAAHHYAGFEDLTWSAARGETPELLRVAGEIDAAGVDSFAAVLRAGIEHGIRTLDASELEFLGAAGAGVLQVMLPLLDEYGAELTVQHPTHLVTRVFDILGLTDSDRLRLTP